MDMKKISGRNWIGVLIFFVSLFFLLWTVWPIKTVSRQISFKPGELQVRFPSSGIQSSENKEGDIRHMAFQDTRNVILEWKPVVRKGDHSKIILKFTGDKANLNDYDSGNSIIDLYKVFNVNAVARIEIPGVGIDPTGLAGQVLPQDHDIEFAWKLIPIKQGIYQGNAWFYLQYFPILEGDFIEQAVSAQAFQINVISLLGLNIYIWRVVGFLGIFLGLFIQVKYLRRRF
jgi:hypothetical protein